MDVEIEDPDGKKISKDANTILNDLAIYSGESRPDGFKFISIPNPVKGDYKIKLIGNGEGKYHVGSIYADYENDVPDQESTTEDLITSGEIKEYKLNYNPDDTEDPVGEIELADTTPPTITVTSPENGKEYLNDQVIPVDYSVADDSSPQDKISITTIYDSEPFTESEIDLSLQNLGEHKFKITATDIVGNQSEKEITFQNTTSLDAIQTNIDHYFDLGLVKRKIARKYLTIKLRHLEKLFDLLEKTENSRLKPKPKQAAVNAIKKIINADIDRLIKQIKRKSPRWIDTRAADLLIESLNSIKLK